MTPRDRAPGKFYMSVEYDEQPLSVDEMRRRRYLHRAWRMYRHYRGGPYPMRRLGAAWQALCSAVHFDADLEA